MDTGLLIPPPDKELEKLSYTLRGVGKWRKVRQVVWPITTGALFLAPLWPVYVLLHSDPLASVMSWLWPILYIVLVVLGLAVRARFYGWLTCNVREAAMSLTLVNNVKAVGPLIDALCLVALERNDDAVKESLIHLLPRLEASDEYLLSDRQRTILRERLTGPFSYRYHNRKLIVATLEVLQKIGEDRDLPPVRRLARGQSYWANDYEIRDGACKCLVALEARKNKTLVLKQPVSTEDSSALENGTVENGDQTT